MPYYKLDYCAMSHLYHHSLSIEGRGVREQVQVHLCSFISSPGNGKIRYVLKNPPGANEHQLLALRHKQN